MSETSVPLPRNPETHQLHRREVFWQITFPLLMGVLLFVATAAGVIWAAAQPLRESNGAPVVSRWADISLIWLILWAMLMALPVLGVLAGLIYGLTWLLKIVPPYAFRAQGVFWKVGDAVQSAADWVAEPILRLQSWWAGLQALQRGRK